MTSFQAICVGQRAALELVVEPLAVERFLELSADDNPLHTDPAAARAAGFEAPIVHGMLMGAWVSRLVGTRLPGHGAVLQSCSLDFVAPVYTGDAIVLSAEVTHKSEAVGCLVLRLEARRGDIVVVRGRAQVGMHG